MARTVDVSRLIDERGVNSFNVGLVIFAFFIILLDGYDIGAASFAAPSLIKEWGITDRSALGTLFSSSLFGILFGAPIFGWIGDRYGRVAAIVASCVTFGAFTLVACWASNLDQLIYLRFFAGIGIGGLPPTLIALTAEFSPAKKRSTMVIVMFCGITLGGAVPGWVSAAFVGTYGWQILFAIGGIFPLVIGLAAAIWMPESLKFLVLKGGRAARVSRIVNRIDPGLQTDASTVFTVQDEKKYEGFSPKYLFEDGLGWITPLLWVCFIVNLMGFYFLTSWMPTLLTNAHFPPGEAAVATSWFQVGGTCGGLLLSVLMDKKGLLPVSVLFICAIPIVGAIGYAAGAGDLTVLMLIVFFAGFCVLGLQFGLNATSGMIYPTAFRSNGSGWAFAVGRFGSVAGPKVGGVLIAMQLSLQALYLLATVPFIVGAIASIALARVYAATFKGEGLGQRAPTGARAGEAGPSLGRAEMAGR
ncbi:MAG: MFS transporter [Alphaproteobacteria bacterium]|nr:MFS transporter [Alphaproteobacteria bacterium]